MIRRPPRSTLSPSSAASDVYKRQLRDAAQQALGALETVLSDAYHRSFQECCGRIGFGCCGNPNEAWTPEDNKIMDLLSPAQRQLSDALRAALAEPAEQEPVAWSVLDKRTGKHWYTHESKYTAQHYANEYSHREPDGSPSMVVTPLYTAPQPQPDDTALLQQCLEALDAALSDDKPYIKECKEAVAAIKERLK